jgi:hypothetical protein
VEKFHAEHSKKILAVKYKWSRNISLKIPTRSHGEIEFPLEEMKRFFCDLTHQNTAMAFHIRFVRAQAFHWTINPCAEGQSLKVNLAMKLLAVRSLRVCVCD